MKMRRWNAYPPYCTSIAVRIHVPQMAAMRTPAIGGRSSGPAPGTSLVDCVQYVLKGGVASPARLILAMKRIAIRADQRARYSAGAPLFKPRHGSLGLHA